MLLSAAAFAFDQAKDAASDAVARQKVADLQALIEQDYSTNHYFPDIASLRGQWLELRPQDATASPYGGPVVDLMSNDGIDGGDLEGSNCVATPQGCPGNPAPTPAEIPDATMRDGVLYYYRINVPGWPVPPCCWTFQDESKGGIATEAAGYMVGANKNYHCFYFVTSGR